MDACYFILFSYLCTINLYNSEKMSKKMTEKFGSPRFFSYLCKWNST